MTADDQLLPTLWRTCRVLANRTRLRLLMSVLQYPHGSVSAVATATGHDLSVTSIGLRALNARGLIGARRHSKWVYYDAETDPRVPAAGALLSAIRLSLREDPDPTDKLFHLFTAFTHPRRIEIVRELARGPRRQTELRARLAISTPALQRHLTKLKRRGIVISTKHGYRLRTTEHPVSDVLVSLASQP
jgi:DNA-binding transcriptional ArsR family regulator